MHLRVSVKGQCGGLSYSDVLTATRSNDKCKCIAQYKRERSGIPLPVARYKWSFFLKKVYETYRPRYRDIVNSEMMNEGPPGA